MSKSLQKMLLAFIAAGLIITWVVVRVNGQEFTIETIEMPAGERDNYCHNGYASVNTIYNAQGGVVGCYANPCGGGEATYFETTTHPGQGCGGGTYEQQLSCTIDNCIGNDTGISPLTEMEYDRVMKRRKAK